MSRLADLSDEFDWLTRHGEIASRLRAMDWTQSLLGTPDSWPQSLRSAINLCLTSKIPMYVWWGPYCINIYNDAYIPIAGPLKHPKHLGRPACEMWPEIWDTMQGFLDRVHDTREAICSDDQLFIVDRDGTPREAMFTFSFNPALDEAGRVQGAIAIVQETTTKVLALRDQARAEREVRAARQELHNFLTQAPIGIAILNGPNHVFTFLNSWFTAHLFGGRPDSDFLKKSVSEALPELDGQGFHEILDNVYRTGKPFVGAKLRASVKQAAGVDAELWVNFTLQAKRDATGKVDGCLALVYEVTDQVNEQKEIELLADNLRAAIVSRDTFLGIASHELNTPLTSLKLQTELTLRQMQKHGETAFPPEKIRRTLEKILSNADRLEALINDMLDVSRIRSGKLQMTLAETDLSALVQSTVDRFSNLLDAARCATALTIAPGIHANIDAARIEQTLANLMTNVVKYAPGKRVEVIVERKGTMARVSVCDEGIGISPENQERIFGRFERATEGNEASGLGLGLYICKQILDAHGGTIFVQSERGKGSTFIFEVPAAR